MHIFGPEDSEQPYRPVPREQAAAEVSAPVHLEDRNHTRALKGCNLAGCPVEIAAIAVVEV